MRKRERERKRKAPGRNGAEEAGIQRREGIDRCEPAAEEREDLSVEREAAKRIKLVLLKREGRRQREEISPNRTGIPKEKREYSLEH